ncbi:MAG: hypothetical protein JWN54_3653, partial [Mycobacterium sp.]|nr:hypothetical protein [Mycobacterium sp.]
MLCRVAPNCTDYQVRNGAVTRVLQRVVLGLDPEALGE